MPVWYVLGVRDLGQSSSDREDNRAGPADAMTRAIEVPASEPIQRSASPGSPVRPRETLTSSHAHGGSP